MKTSTKTSLRAAFPDYTDEQLEAIQTRLKEKAGLDADLIKDEAERHSLMLCRASAIMTLIDEAGYNKSNVDVAMSIMALAFAAGMNAEVTGVGYDLLMEAILMGRNQVDVLVSKLQTEAMLEKMAKNPQGQA